MKQYIITSGVRGQEKVLSSKGTQADIDAMLEAHAEEQTGIELKNGVLTAELEDGRYWTAREAAA